MNLAGAAVALGHIPDASRINCPNRQRRHGTAVGNPVGQADFAPKRLEAGGVGPSRRTVGVLAVPNHSDFDDGRSVVDSVDDPVITHSNSPKVIGAPQLFAASESRLFGE